MKTNKKIVSVIIPVYNMEKYLKKCLKSVLNQTYKNLEIIIVNDGSTDNSLRIIKNVMKNRKYKLIDKSNGGLSSARNAGLNIANGDYIYFLDSDDYLSNGYIEEMVNEINKSNYDLVHNQNIYLYYGKNGKDLKTKPTERLEIENKTQTFFIYWGVWSCLFKKELFLDNNIRFFEGWNNEDYGLQAIISPYVKKYLFFYGTNEYYYRKHNDSITSKYNNNVPLDILYQLDKAFEFYKERKLNLSIFPYFMLFIFLRGQDNEKEFLDQTFNIMQKHGINLSDLRYKESLINRNKDIFLKYNILI